MKNKLITIILTIIIFLVPTVTIPQQIAETTFIQGSSFARILILLICGAILLIALIVKHKELKFDTTDKLLLIFYALAWISTIFSVRITDSIWGEKARYEGVITIGVYLLIYYCAKNYFSYYKHFTRIVCIFAGIIAVYAIFQRFGLLPIHNILNIPYNSTFVSGTLLHHNFLGSFLTIFLPITMCIYIIKGKNMYLGFSILLFIATLCCMTRSAWVAFLVYTLIIFIYIIIKNDKKIWLRSGILCLTLAFSFIVIFCAKDNQLNNRIDTFIGETKYVATSIVDNSVSNDNTSNGLGSARIYIWKMAIQEIMYRPLTGCGVDALKRGFVEDQKMSTYNFWLSTGQVPDKAHNEYLQIAATMGIPALIIYVLAIATILDKSIKTIFKENISFIFVTSIIAYLVQAFFNISVIMVAPLFWFLLGLSNNNEAIKKMKKELKK